MEINYFPKFSRQYKKLAPEIRREAEVKSEIFSQNPFDPRLKTHKLHGPLGDFYAFSVDKKYRIIFDFLENGEVGFYAIGDHDIYE